MGTPAPVRSYGDGGKYRPSLRTVDRTFPKTHTHPSAPSVKAGGHGFSGSVGEVTKLAVKSIAAYFGVPSSYAAVPVTALFSNFGMEGEPPDRKAQLLGYKDAAQQKQMIEAAKARGVK